MLADKHTLLVHFQEDPSGKCIHCEKCVRACPMGIDIRRSSHQLECTHCAECIDACSEVLGKMGRGSLIHYAWGDDEQNAVTESKWYRRIGLRDGKRVAILCCSSFTPRDFPSPSACGKPCMVRIMPDRITLYTRGADGLIHNRFRILASNRGKSEAKVTFSLTGLPAARILGMDDGITLKPGENLQREFDIAADASRISLGVNHMTIWPTSHPRKRTTCSTKTLSHPWKAHRQLRQPGKRVRSRNETPPTLPKIPRAPSIASSAMGGIRRTPTRPCLEQRWN